ncbi:MAG: hypothetical protein HY881_10080 [Deltaproteobacteria bacterium]|nr:hypothetical protein [Deltaproteobacteria bacterium]
MIIKGIPDQWNLSKNKNLSVLSNNWLNSVASDLKNCLSTKDKRITVDLSNINFISAFNWVIFTVIINRILDSTEVDCVDIDLVGGSKFEVMEPKEYLRYLYNQNNYSTTYPSDFNFSHRVYQIAGFLEAFGTRIALLTRGRNVSISYPWLNIQDAQFQDFYSHKDTRPTVFLGLTKIETEDNCKLFLEDDMVQNWRNSMRERFKDSPILETEEIWRSICHELSTNMWEHSNSSGFIFYRVVTPLDKNNKVRWWCRKEYEESLGTVWEHFTEGFLEICAIDSGDGFVKSLGQAYLNQSGISVLTDVNISEILSFAFDEFGTRKTEDESWVLTRHALGRILLIVSKYGGVLTLRSDGVQLRYISSEKRFKRKSNGMGYKPSSISEVDKNIIGSHIQIILPLYPQVTPEDFVKRDSVFDYLPNTYTIDPEHVRGHLIPVLESIGIGFKDIVSTSDDIKIFRNACIRLNNTLRNQHPASEPLVFDFSGINWGPAQFETFLYLLQNIIQKRLVLLVEIDPRLAQEVKRIEGQLADTYIDKEALGATSEKKFFETYTGINHIVLGVDKNGIVYLFGLSDLKYERAILSLIEVPDTIEGMCNYIDSSKANESYCRTILTKENPLFYLDENNRWNCSWETIEISQQANRIISEHFDQIAKNTESWHGQLIDYNGQLGEFDQDNLHEAELLKTQKFNLPWQEEWRETFLESSNFLSRERYCDEAAQRLIYRLICGLSLLNRSLNDVKLFVCVTAPALMLASSMHRWWPNICKPIVVDLSYNVLLESSSSLPSIVNVGGIVIVQDIFELGKVSGELLRRLKKQSKDIICAISLLKFNRNISKTRIVPVEQGWDLKDHDILGVLPNHSLLEIPSPKKCPPPNETDDDSNLFWIEPRSLHPTSYKHLRRDFGEGRDPYLKRRDEILPEFDSINNGCLFAAGHYVYGHRHYQVAIDVKKLLNGKIGTMIAHWIADVCVGNPIRKKAEWERSRGFDFKGDVTFVLMPLHSQIHYLWPEIRNILAQRGRRQIMSLLDATLFTGRRPTYRISNQLEQQIRRASLDAIEAWHLQKGSHPSPLRILILDDAIASARSAETILLSINNRLNKIFRKAQNNIDELPSEYHPIQWIRYFAILNQMGHANYTLWHNMKHIGTPPINFILEEYAPFMGVPLFEEKDCPYCIDRTRLKQLITNCSQFGANMTAEWAKDIYSELKPVAIDGPTFRKKEPFSILSGIDILGLKSKKMETHPIKYISKYADTAIWRFHKLMHLSYPIDDILNNINKWWEYKIAEKEKYDDNQKVEYQRYRWAVIDWCIKNWSRVKASTARNTYVKLIKHELSNNTELVEKFLNACSLIYEDIYISELIKGIIHEFELLELQRKDEDKVIDKERISKINRFETGLTTFFLNIPEIIEDSIYVSPTDNDESIAKELLKELENSTKRLNKTGTRCSSFLFQKKQGVVAVSGNLLRIPPCRNLHSVIVRPATTIPHLPFKTGDFKIICNILK